MLTVLKVAQNSTNNATIKTTSVLMKCKSAGEHAQLTQMLTQWRFFWQNYVELMTSQGLRLRASNELYKMAKFDHF